jgi:hypothetical protein
MHRIFRTTFISMANIAACRAHAQVAQSGSNPIVLRPGAPIDDVQVLMATAAARSADITVFAPDTRKNFYIQNFQSGTDYLKWTVAAPAAATYRVFALVNAAQGQQFKVLATGSPSVSKPATAETPASIGTAATLSWGAGKGTVPLVGPSFATFAATGNWDKIAVGAITLPAGTSTITLTRTGTLANDAQVKSLELIRESDYRDYMRRVDDARGDTRWLASAKYGLFFQYGSWGFPNNVGLAKSLNQQAADFDVPAFVRMVKDTGASYVIWSFSWWNFKPDMRNHALDHVMGEEYTSQRNLIAEVASSLRKEGIRFVLYYHTGDEDSGWWPKQSFPASFSTTGTGDRSTFLKNWASVVADIGETLGKNLDAFFFDDGLIYYPAPFEKMEKVARSGNPRRLISWNSWVLPRYTDFQDVYFGEGSTGTPMTGSAGVGRNGIFTSGPQQGLLQHGMFQLESGDWGIHTQHQQVGNSIYTGPQLVSLVQSASSRHVPLSLNYQMYEDGSFSNTTLSALYGLRNGIYHTDMALPPQTTYNDNWANIYYTGNWSAAKNRNAGDYGNDVHYTSANGASYTVTFNGTGVILSGPMSPQDGTADVSLDGDVKSTINTAYNGSYSLQQHLLEFSHLDRGPHTVTVTKTGGAYLQLDSVTIIQ